MEWTTKELALVEAFEHNSFDVFKGLKRLTEQQAQERLFFELGYAARLSEEMKERSKQ